MGMTNFTGIIGKGRSNGSRQPGSDRSYKGPRNSLAKAMDEWHRARPDLDLRPLGLFAALAHVYWLTAPEIERLMAVHGVTRGMFDLLTTLRRAGPPYTLAPKQLSQSLLLSGAGITNRLDKLEALKLIRRLPEPLDRRGLKVRLTPPGMRLVDRLLPQLIRLESSLAAGMTKRQVLNLTRLLDEFARTLQRPAPVRTELLSRKARQAKAAQ
jgi:DNA-binding MarR family transcriptional regulator